MGAETETDGQGDAMKQKWHKLYGNYITYLILVGLGLYYISLIALDIWIFHAPDLSFSIPCFLLLTCPAVLSIVLSYKPQVFSRLLTRCSFDAEGIHCRSPRWGRFTLRWDEIRTYGFMGTPFPICPCRFCTSRWTRRSMHPKMAARWRGSAATGSFFSIGRPSGRR